MRRWIVALVAATAFGAGWIAHDATDSIDCVTPDRSGQSIRERAEAQDIAFRCE